MRVDTGSLTEGFRISGDSAEFVAGVWYGYSSRKLDIFNGGYLGSCSTWNIRLDQMPQRMATTYLLENNIPSGNKQLRDTEPYFRTTMADCSCTNAFLEGLADRAQDFNLHANPVCAWLQPMWACVQIWHDLLLQERVQKRRERADAVGRVTVQQVQFLLPC